MASEATAIMEMTAVKNDHQGTAEPTAAPMATKTGVLMEITTTVAKTTPTVKIVGRRVMTATAGTAPLSLQTLVLAVARVAQARTKATRASLGSCSNLLK